MEEEEGILYPGVEVDEEGVLEGGASGVAEVGRAQQWPSLASPLLSKQDSTDAAWAVNERASIAE